MAEMKRPMDFWKCLVRPNHVQFAKAYSFPRRYLQRPFALSSTSSTAVLSTYVQSGSVNGETNMRYSRHIRDNSPCLLHIKALARTRCKQQVGSTFFVMYI